MINSIVLPSLAKSTNSLSIYLTTSDGYAIASLTSGVTFTPLPGSFPAPTIVPTDPVILTQTLVAITFVPKHALDRTARFTLTFPSAYVLTSSCTLSDHQNVNQAALCQVTGQTVTVNNLLTSGYASGSGIVLGFTLSAVTLPQVNVVYSGFASATMINDTDGGGFYKVDTFSGSIPISIGSGKLEAKVTPGSVTAYDKTTYTFSITPSHYIPENGYITLVYPPTVIIEDPSFSQS